MGRIWAMGCSASNASSDLAERAASQAFVREEMIRRVLSANGEVDSAEIDARLRQARATLKTLRHEDSPDAERWGAPAPMFVRGELYQTTEVERRPDGSIVREGVRFNGPQMSRIRVREEPEGGAFTRVVAEAR